MQDVSDEIVSNGNSLRAEKPGTDHDFPDVERRSAGRGGNRGLSLIITVSLIITGP